MNNAHLMSKIIDSINYHIPIKELRIEIYEDIIDALNQCGVTPIELENAKGSDIAFDMALNCE